LSRSQEGQGQKTSHLLVDTQGLVLMVKVHRANVTDRDGIKLLLTDTASTGLQRLWLDAGYTGQEDRGAGWMEKVLGWMQRSLGTLRSRLHRR
jgi:putative transposase